MDFPIRCCLYFTLLILGASEARVWAIGGAAFGDEVLSARSIGQAHVGVAGQSEDPAVVYLNPAAMTALPGTQVTVGLTGVDPHGHYRSPSGAESGLVNPSGVVPNFAFTQRLHDSRVSVGFAAEAPWGFKSHWPDDGPLRYVATDAKLYMVDLTPAISYQLSSTVSLGLAADFFDAFHVLQARRIPNINAPDGNSQLTAQGTGWGIHGGVMLTPTSHHSFGLAYHDKVKLTIKGTAELDGMATPLSLLMGGAYYETSTYTDLFIPQNVQFAYAFRPDPAWMLEVDTAWYDWDSNRDLNLRFGEQDPGRLAVLNAGNPVRLDRRSAWTVTTGANYRFSDRWQFRSGLGYLPHATPDWTFQPSVNDLTRFGICVGTGWHFAPRWTLDLAYSVVFARSRRIADSVPSGVDGEYSNRIDLLAANLTVRLPYPGPSQ